MLQIFLSANCDLQVSRAVMADSAYVPAETFLQSDGVRIHLEINAHRCLTRMHFDAGEVPQPLEGNVEFERLFLNIVSKCYEMLAKRMVEVLKRAVQRC